MLTSGQGMETENLILDKKHFTGQFQISQISDLFLLVLCISPAIESFLVQTYQNIMKNQTQGQFFFNLSTNSE